MHSSTTATTTFPTPKDKQVERGTYIEEGDFLSEIKEEQDMNRIQNIGHKKHRRHHKRKASSSNSNNKNNSSPRDEKDKDKAKKQKYNPDDPNAMITLTPGGPVSEDVIAYNFVMLTLIGRGAFGQIILSFNLRDNTEVAIKKEVRRPGKSPQLKTEAKIYQSLLKISENESLDGTKPLPQDDVIGVPKFYGMGEFPDGWYLIIEFLGPNLIELLNFCGTKKYTISTVCLLALQIWNRIENWHKHSFIHRDIKPENFWIGTQGKSNVVYLVDFGLSKRYKNPKNQQHIPYREGRQWTGTARYVSVNTHLGIEQSRRDDLESIGYALTYFLKGTLPWQGWKGGNNKYERILDKKLQIPTEILCLGLPDEMPSFLNYCKSLRFEDQPDYDYLRGLFISLWGKCVSLYGWTKEMLKFDWCFDDPVNSIWHVFGKKDKNTVCNANTQKKNESEGKESLSNKDNLLNDNDCRVEETPQGQDQVEVLETPQGNNNVRNFAITNENNPNACSSGNDNMSSGEGAEQGKNKKCQDSPSKDNSDQDKENEKNGEGKEESEATWEQEFNGFLNLQVDQDKIIVNDEIKKIFFEGKGEEIDKYLDQMLKKKDIMRQSARKKKNEEAKCEEESIDVKEGKKKEDEMKKDKEKNEEEKEKEKVNGDVKENDKEKETEKQTRADNTREKNDKKNSNYNNQDWGQVKKEQREQNNNSNSKSESDKENIKDASDENIINTTKKLKDSLDIPSPQPLTTQSVPSQITEIVDKADKDWGILDGTKNKNQNINSEDLVQVKKQNNKSKEKKIKFIEDESPKNNKVRIEEWLKGYEEK